MHERQAEIAARLKRLIVERLDLELTEEEIGDDQQLFGSDAESVGLDSVEALEIAVISEAEFGVRMDEDEAFEHFYSIATLSAYIADLEAAATSKGLDSRT